MRKSIVSKRRDRPPSPRTSGRMFNQNGRAPSDVASQLKLLRQRLRLLDDAIKAVERLQYALTHDCVTQ